VERDGAARLSAARITGRFTRLKILFIPDRCGRRRIGDLGDRRS
jgi:hypothetical protein